MTAIVVLAVATATLVAAWVVWSFRRRAIERERRRVEALTAVAQRLGSAKATLDRTAAPPEPSSRPPAPLTQIAPGRRAAFVAVVSDAVTHARAEDERLAVALVTAVADAQGLAASVRAVVSETYVVGPRSVAFVLPALGRAEALGVLARIQAACGAHGRAAELEPGEDAVELLARLLPDEGAWPEPGTSF